MRQAWGAPPTRKRLQAGSPDWSERVSLCAQTANAVEDVHHAGVAHNDVKVHLHNYYVYILAHAISHSTPRMSSVSNGNHSGLISRTGPDVAVMGGNKWLNKIDEQR